MKLVERYIAKTVLSSIYLVTVILVGLQVFIVFVNQLEDIGRADYTVWAALQFVLLDLPYQVYLFFPMASLMGTLMGLGVLANHHELVVLRASGMSVGQVIVAVFKVSLVIIFCVTVLGETVIPHLSRYAADIKLAAMSAGQTIRSNGGIWLRQGDDMVHIDEILPDGRLEQVTQFHFNEQHVMTFARKIREIRHSQKGWIAEDVKETLIEPDKTSATFQKSMLWELSLNPKILRISGNEPDEMTMPELRKYLNAQKANHQTALNYELAFWQRLIQPLATLVMMVLAIPFIFGPLRTATLGSRLVTGAIVGFGFHMVNRFFGPLSQVYQWPPLLAAVMPTLLFAIIAIYGLKRVR